MFEITNGRYIDASRVIGANVYNKDTGQVSGKDGSRIMEIRVAIDLDTENKDKSSVYAGPFDTEQKAKDFIKSIPIRNKV